VQVISSRTTARGHSLGAVALANLTAVVPLGQSFELTGAVRNVFDVAYADPASDQGAQDSIRRTAAPYV
jgi:hypothetical protein